MTLVNVILEGVNTRLMSQHASLLCGPDMYLIVINLRIYSDDLFSVEDTFYSRAQRRHSSSINDVE